MFGWLVRLFNGGTKVVDEDPLRNPSPPQDMVNDSQFIKLQDLHKSLREKIEACTDLLEQRIAALKQKKSEEKNQ